MRQREVSVFEFFRSPWYQKDRDGGLGIYLKKRCIEREAETLFLRMEGFNLLKNNGLFQYGISIIRVMWNIGRGDEYYYVVEENGNVMLKGIVVNGAHDGKPGLHKPEDILENRTDAGSKETMTFELHYPDVDAIKRLEDKGE